MLLLVSQLLEVAVALIKAIKEWANDNDIVLGESHKLNMLLNEARSLIEEIDRTQLRRKFRKLASDDFLQLHPSTEDLTEPGPIFVTTKPKKSESSTDSCSVPDTRV